MNLELDKTERAALLKLLAGTCTSKALSDVYYRLAAKPARQKAKADVTVELTVREAHALNLVAGNGWGDGDFAQWLGNPAQSNACCRAMKKLERAAHQ